MEIGDLVRIKHPFKASFMEDNIGIVNEIASEQSSTHKNMIEIILLDGRLFRDNKDFYEVISER
jgi:hypothetical protein